MKNVLLKKKKEHGIKSVRVSHQIHAKKEQASDKRNKKS